MRNLKNDWFMFACFQGRFCQFYFRMIQYKRSALLILVGFQIKTYSSHSTSCPELCTCYNDNTVVFCSEQPYKIIPDLPLNVTELWMKDSDLRSLDESITDLSKYKNLTDIKGYIHNWYI